MISIRQVSFLFAILFLPTLFQTGEEGINLTLSGLRNTKGHVLVSIFKDGEGFPSSPETAFRKEKLDIKGDKVTLHLKDIPAGDYAIAILHDENDDAKMNTNWLGIPKEGYGFSNNATGTLGPPAYSKAKFTHTAGKETFVSIRTRY